MTEDRYNDIAQLKAKGLGYRKIGKMLDMPWHDVYNTWRRYERKQVKPAENENARQLIDAERQRARTQLQLQELKQLTSKRVVIEEWREAIREAALALETPTLLPSAKSKSKEEEVAVLLLSDVHMGQYTTARVNGGWTQSSDVTENQFYRLSDLLLRMHDLQKAAVPWKRLVILDLGDDVDGDNMRNSQHRMVDQLVVQQTARVGRLLAELVATALTVFEHVRVERIPGNHGRTTQKPSYSGLAELDPIDSYDWLAGEFAREILREPIRDGRVEIINHDSYYAITEIIGHRVLFEHGASLKGGGSWGGIPYYGIDKAAASYRDLEGQFTMLALGHYHRSYELPCGYGGMVVGNGAFPPTSPFVVTGKHQASQPSQTLLSLHPKHGITQIRRLKIETVRDGRVA